MLEVDADEDHAVILGPPLAGRFHDCDRSQDTHTGSSPAAPAVQAQALG